MLRSLRLRLIMRSAFIDELVFQATTNNKLVLIVGDLGYGVVEPFSTKFPERFFNAGVAEQSMMGLAAGMASEGYHVFVYSIANFPTFRCAEQIRNDIDYHNLPVTIVAAGGGLSYGNLGYSHHAVQDYALMRVLPNMLIASPGDPMEVRGCMRFLINNPQPSYMRLGKSGEPNIHEKVPDIYPGKLVNVKAGSNSKTFITTGTVLDLVMKAVSSKDSLRDWAINSMPLWGMKFKSNQDKNISVFSSVITLEDHLVDGGFGSWLIESINDFKNLAGRVHIKGLSSDVCGMVAKQAILNSIGGISEDSLCE
jgi:transketolase